jgi:hypothetical protein
MVVGHTAGAVLSMKTATFGGVVEWVWGDTATHKLNKCNV